MKKIIIGCIGQWIGLLMSIFGIVLLSILSEQYGAVFISGGSIAWGVGTKLKYYSSIKAIEAERGKRISIDDLLSDHNIIPYKAENKNNMEGV